MSFLQRRMAEQAKKDATDKAALGAAMDGFDEQSAAAVAAPPAPPIAAQRQPEPAQMANHNVPDKRVTSPKVAQLRRQFRPKLLAAIDEADQWQRGDAEKEAILIKRLDTVLQKAGIHVNRAEYDELKEALLNDLLCFCAI